MFSALTVLSEWTSRDDVIATVRCGQHKIHVSLNVLNNKNIIYYSIVLQRMDQSLSLFLYFFILQTRF